MEQLPTPAAYRLLQNAHQCAGNANAFLPVEGRDAGMFGYKASARERAEAARLEGGSCAVNGGRENSAGDEERMLLHSGEMGGSSSSSSSSSADADREAFAERVTLLHSTLIELKRWGFPDGGGLWRRESGGETSEKECTSTGRYRRCAWVANPLRQALLRLLGTAGRPSSATADFPSAPPFQSQGDGGLDEEERVTDVTDAECFSWAVRDAVLLCAAQLLQAVYAHPAVTAVSLLRVPSRAVAS